MFGFLVFPQGLAIMVNVARREVLSLEFFLEAVRTMRPTFTILHKLLRQLSEPLKSIKYQPYHFVVWCLVAYVVGLAGLWLPLLILYRMDRPVYPVFENIVNAGYLASFCVVILAEGIATNLCAHKTGSSQIAVGIRGLFCILAFILAIIPVGIMVGEHVGQGDSHVAISFQVQITLIAILLGAYLYSFRYPSWGEKEVSFVKEEEDNDVLKLAEQAQKQLRDDKGVKL
jgi:hypothetical protein